MKNKLVVFMLSAALLAPAAALWASAGDSTLQGTNGSQTGAAATPKTKKHHGHHHKKPQVTATPSTTPAK